VTFLITKAHNQFVYRPRANSTRRMDLIGTIEDDDELSVVESDDSEQRVNLYLWYQIYAHVMNSIIP